MAYEAKLGFAAGFQGSGKTYQAAYQIRDYVRSGKKAILFDANAEFTLAHLQEYGITDFPIKTLRLEQLSDWLASPLIEARRILPIYTTGLKKGQYMSAGEKQLTLQFMIDKVNNCLLFVEDVNTYMRQTQEFEKLAENLVKLRHKSVDVLVHYQSLAPVTTLIWQNAKWFRLHDQLDDVDRYENRIPEFDMVKIAQLIVKKKLMQGNQYFNLTVLRDKRKLAGEFSLNDFINATREMLYENTGRIKREANKLTISSVNAKLTANELRKKAEEALIIDFVKKYYGN